MYEMFLKILSSTSTELGLNIVEALVPDIHCTVFPPPLGTGPRVVTVNTINAPKASVSGIRTPAPATVVSVGPKTIQTVRVTPQGPTGLRPVLSGAKSNVIVVHKGAPAPGTRPMNIQGIRVSLCCSKHTVLDMCL